MPAQSVQRRPAAPALARALLGAAVLAAALSATAQAQPMAPQGGMHGGMHGEGPHRAMAHRMGPGQGGAAMLSDRALDAVGASADQKARIRDIMGKARDDLRQQHQADRALHEKMMGLVAAPQIDAAAAEDLRRQLNARRDEASKRQLQALLDAGAVLTPEQRQALAERGRKQRDMMERHRRERESMAPRS